LQNQVFGIAITELTALLSRRSVYCSKTANGKYSVCNSFADEQGNIRFKTVNTLGKRALLLVRGERGRIRPQFRT